MSLIDTLWRVLRAVDHARTLLRALTPTEVQVHVQWGQFVVLYPAEAIADPTLPALPPLAGPAPVHVAGDDCPCGQLDVPVEHADGAITFVTACALEEDADPQVQAERAATIFEGIAEQRWEGPE